MAGAGAAGKPRTRRPPSWLWRAGRRGGRARASGRRRGGFGAVGKRPREEAGGVSCGLRRLIGRVSPRGVSGPTPGSRGPWPGGSRWCSACLEPVSGPVSSVLTGFHCAPLHRPPALPERGARAHALSILSSPRSVAPVFLTRERTPGFASHLPS